MRAEGRRCPYCRELVDGRTIICPHCHQAIPKHKGFIARFFGALFKLTIIAVIVIGILRYLSSP